MDIMKKNLKKKIKKFKYFRGYGVYQIDYISLELSDNIIKMNRLIRYNQTLLMRDFYL